MKIVLDTNILIAAFISHGACTELFEHCVRNHDVIGSEFILKEFSKHMTGKFKVPAREVSQTMRLLRSRISVVVPVKLDKNVCRDPKDHHILGGAIKGKCQCIITGDKDLLILKKFQGVNIFSPRQFWEYESKITADNP